MILCTEEMAGESDDILGGPLCTLLPLRSVAFKKH